MAAPHILSARLACADYRREGLLTACGVLGLAAVLAPLLILYGVKFGVVETLTARLIHNPATLEVAPAGSGRYSAAYVASLGENPDVGFALPRTRAIAATVALSRPAAPGATPRSSRRATGRAWRWCSPPDDTSGTDGRARVRAGWEQV